MPKSKKNTGTGGIQCGPCAHCSAYTPFGQTHNCAKEKREKEKAAAKLARHNSVNDKMKRRPPPPPPPPPPPAVDQAPAGR